MRTACALAALGLVACTTSDSGEMLDIECAGKCDAFDSIESLMADAKKLDLGDLISVSAGFATDKLNEELSFANFASIRIGEPRAFARKAVADNDLTINDIDELVSGMAARFGERALTTEVNAIRAEQLDDSRSGYTAYGESTFEIRAGLNQGWNLVSGGLAADLDVSVRLGFAADIKLRAHTVSAFKSDIRASLLSPLEAAKAARGFILPRSIDDIDAMAPGESFALQGSGRLGVNLGIGVPILIAEPASFLTYRIVLTAGLRTMLEGVLDVQLVRMRGDEIVIDVGVETTRVNASHIGIHDGWGVSGLLDLVVDVGPVADVDLGRLVEKALQSRLNRSLNLIEGQLSTSEKKTRLSVARLRFSLDGPDPLGAREQAIAQALRGDVRLAQALANREDSGVIAEFDLLRSGVSATSHAGIQLLGMHFFVEQEAAEGSVVLQTPGGARSLLFESLHRVAGWFFSSHGFTRVGLSGLIVDARNGSRVRGEANLFLQVEEGDRFMARDKVIDHVDGILLPLVGAGTLSAMEIHANELERYVLATCPLPDEFCSGGPQDDCDNSPFSESCNIDLIENDARFAQLKTAAMAALETGSFHLPAEHRDLVRELGQLRIAAQSIQDPRDLAAGPTASMVVDFRLDDNALSALFASRSGHQLSSNLVEYMRFAQIDRTDPEFANDRDKISATAKPVADSMAELFDAYAAQYNRVREIESAAIQTLGNIGTNSIEIRFPVDADNAPIYEQATSQSLAQVRSQLALDMFDEMRDEAKDFDSVGGNAAPHSEQVVAYGLLSLIPPGQWDLRVDFDTDNDSCFVCLSRDRYDAAGFKSVDIYVRGQDVSPIDGGLFDVDALIDIN